MVVLRDRGKMEGEESEGWLSAWRRSEGKEARESHVKRRGGGVMCRGRGGRKGRR